MTSILFFFVVAAIGQAEPPSEQTLARRVDALLAAEHFEEALRLIDGEKTGLDAAARVKVREKIEGGRKAALARYEQSLDLALRTIAASSPIEEPEYVPLLLRKAVPPRTAIATLPARFAWVEEFLSLYETFLPKIRSLEKLGTPELLSAARAVEGTARAAREARLFAEFQTALSVAHALRRARVLSLADGRDDVELERVVTDSEQALASCDRGLGAHPSGIKEIEDFRSAVLAPYGAMLRQAREQSRVRTRFRSDLELWAAKAERCLTDSSTMANPEALRAAAAELGPYEEHAGWKDVRPALRARALLARGILEATAGILEGAAADQAFDRVAPKVRAARALDPGVDEAWKGRLSPKIVAGLERLGR